MAEPASIKSLPKLSPLPPSVPAAMPTTSPPPSVPAPMPTTSPSPPVAPSPASAAEPASSKPLTMRGRKRHKCMVCGNIARSRCPFFSCKGCCVKAANACHIHVLKPSPTGESVHGGSAATLPTQGTVTSTFVKHPYDSLRLRTVRPPGLITKKEAGIINGWRFRKLRAYIEGISAYEDEAFDRYMHNNLLLEELFNVSYSDSPNGQGPLLMASYERSDGEIDTAAVSALLQVRQRMSLKKREAHKQRLRRAIDRSLQKLLHKGEETDDFTENEEIYLSGFAARRELKRMKVQSAEGKERLRRMEVFGSLMEKLKVVENQEDFDSCLKTYEENFVCHRMPVSSRNTSQTVAFEGHTTSGMDHPKSGENGSAPDVTCNASFKSRLDSYGVMKETWKVDTDVQVFDVPTCNLENL